MKGIVGYQAGTNAPFKAIFGRLDLPDDAIAVTQAGAQAVLRLKDSSEIDIGEKTSVQIGAFNAVDSGKTNEIVLNGGALHFNIRHPVGGQSNYKFTTATSQIAVRGTEGFLLSSASGTQVVCVSCAVGDVTVQTGSQVTTIVTGQTAVISGTSAANASVNVVQSSPNNSSLSQFNSSSSTTSSASSTAGSTTTSVASGAGGTVATVAGAAGVATVVVATANKTGGDASPSPTSVPTGPTPTPTTSPPGSIVAAFSVGGQFSAFATFPQAFQLNASQQNATTPFTLTVGPANVIGPITTNQTSAPPNLAASFTGNVIGPGGLVITLSASGQTVGPVTVNIWGGVQSSPTTMNFTSVGAGSSQTLQISQAGPAGTLSISKSCVAGADVSFQPASGPSPLNTTVTAVSAPSSPSSAAACTLTVTGSGTGPAASLQIPVNITATSIGISNTKRAAAPSSKKPQ